MSNLIEVRDIHHKYNSEKEVLGGLSFSIKKGVILCLLGKNGAGKTTLLRILGTQLKPTSGTIRIFGIDSLKEPEKIRGKIGVVPQGAKPNMQLSVYDNIFYIANIRGMKRQEAKKKTLKLIKQLNLEEYKNQIVAELSGGNMQRVMLAMVLTTDVELLFLDEPTVGIDPVGRREIWRMIKQLASSGITIFITTHYMDEADFLADNLLVLEKGEIIFSGTPAEAKAQSHEKTKITLSPKMNDIESEPLTIIADSQEEMIDIISHAIKEKRFIQIRQSTLEEAFIQMVGANHDN
ncbi:ABC transporter ATP-binding protein [Candidatus Harpocratesius sp.]